MIMRNSTSVSVHECYFSASTVFAKVIKHIQPRSFLVPPENCVRRVRRAVRFSILNANDTIIFVLSSHMHGFYAHMKVGESSSKTTGTSLCGCSRFIPDALCIDWSGTPFDGPKSPSTFRGRHRRRIRSDWLIFTSRLPSSQGSAFLLDVFLASMHVLFQE